MPKFRKKPVVIEAMQYDGSERSFDQINAWAGGKLDCDWASPASRQPNPVWIVISTLEGVMQAHSGDWIIRGIKGEFYPCKPDIFEATYEPVAAEGERG